jgi:protein-S-isoprenylcysteine O-methyltransferase Ste14
MLRTLRGALGSTVVFALALIAPAREWRWGQAWTLVVIFFAIRLAGGARIERTKSGLLVERAKLPLQSGQPLADKVLLLLTMAAYTCELVLTGLDRRYWNAVGTHFRILAPAGLVLFVFGWLLVMRALEINAFATTVVRHQTERGHSVVDWDVYRAVRHPMYSGLVAAMLGMPLWLGSVVGIEAALVPIALLAVRIVLEERVLRHALPGYATYATRTRWRLIPGVW